MREKRGEERPSGVMWLSTSLREAVCTEINLILLFELAAFSGDTRVYTVV